MKRRPDGRWQKRITLSDGRSKLFYSSAKTERLAIADFNRQMLEYDNSVKNKNFFKTVAENWEDETFDNLENNSLKVYRPALRECIDFFGDKTVQEISPSDVKNFVTSYEKRGYAQKTIKNKLLVLNLIMKYALINQLITTNPCQFIVIKNTHKTEKRQQVSKETIELIRSSTDCTFGFFALFLLYTGLRRGEAFALTPKDIDYENQTLHITKTVEWIGNKPRIKNCPKTIAGNRVIPLPDILMPELIERKKHNYIFQNENGALMDNSQVTRAWNKYVKESGVDATPHMLRHTYATLLFDADIDVKTSQTWLGHTDIKTTLDIYTHLSEQRRENATEKWKLFVKA